MTAKELCDLMKHYKLTQAHAARLFGMRQQAVSFYSRGVRKIPPYIEKEVYFFQHLPLRKRNALVEKARHRSGR